MKKLKTDKAGRFLSGLSCSLAAVVWNALYPTNGWQTLVIAIACAAMWFVPWDRWQGARLVILLIGVGVSAGGSVDLMSALFTDIPRWQWWLAWIILVFSLCYVGRGGILPAAVPVGLVSGILLLLTCVAALPQYDGVVEWGGGSFQRALSGVVALSACSLSAPESHGATRWGALVGIGVWCGSAFVPMLLWSDPALGSMTFPLVRSWQCIGVGSPDILLVAAITICALWQCSLGLLSAAAYVYKLTSLQK